MEPFGMSFQDFIAFVPCGKTKGWELMSRGEVETYKVDGATRVTTESAKAYVTRQLDKQREAA